MSQFETLIYEKHGAVARISLNRPRVLNAYNSQTEITPQVVAVIEGPVSNGLAKVSTPLDIQRQDAYMLSHAQLMGMNQQGFTPLVKLATYGRQ